MVILRKILFYVFLSLYLVLCPLIILYGLGYIFTPKVEEGFAKTGLIHFETVPAGASILIGNKQYTEKTPATVRNLLPGIYDVKIVHPAFQAWERKVNIQPGKAVAFDKILLIPERLEPQTIITQPFKNFLPVPGTRFLILFKTGRLGDMLVFDWKSETFRPFLAANSLFKDFECERIFFSKNSRFLLLQVKNQKKTGYLGCQLLDKQKPRIRDLSVFFKRGGPSEIQWEGDDPDYLFALYGGSIDRLDLKKKAVVQGFLGKVQGYGVHKNKVYALKSASVLRIETDAKKGNWTVVDQGLFLKNLFYGKETFKIDFPFHDIVCFLGARGEFLVNEPPYRFVEEGIGGYALDPSGKKILLWQKDGIGVLDFSITPGRKGIFKRGPEIEWIFNKGKAIRQAYFVYSGSQAVFLDGDELFLISLREGEKWDAQPLGRVLSQSGIFYSERTGLLYYLEPSRGYLMAVEILPPEARPLDYVISEIEKETAGAPR